VQPIQQGKTLACVSSGNW